MNKNAIKWSITAVVLVALIFGATFLYNNLSEDYKANNVVTLSSSQKEGAEEDTSEKSDIGDFTLLDLSSNEVNFSKFQGKPIVLNFWTSWCGYCKEEMPDFDKASKEYPDVQFVMVNATADKRETEFDAREYIQNNNFDLDFYFDIDKEAVVEYNVNSYPTTYFIDASGSVVSYSAGSLDYEGLIDCIEMIT